METSKKQISLFTEDKSTSLPVDSPANLIQQQGKDLEKRMTDISGRKCLEQFERFSHVGLWAKTFGGLLIGMEGWYSTRCRLTWKMKGTKSNRLYFQLAVSTLPTEEIESGLLPTITRTDAQNFPNKLETGTIEKNESGYTFVRKKDGMRFGASIREVVQTNLLPTPDTQNHRDPNNLRQITKEAATRGSKRGISLHHALGMGMLPTPTASEGGTKMTGNDKEQKSVLKIVKQTYGKTSQLNTLFVGEMMGFPENWTVLPFLNGETNQ